MEILLQLEFTNRFIKFKTTFIKKPLIDWKTVKEKDKVNNKFNVNSRNRLQTPFNYTKFNDDILCSGEDTAMINNSENQGWFHFSRNTLVPTREARNSVLHDIRSYNNTPHLRTLCHLKTLQHKVNEAVSVAKTRQSCHLVEEIHNIPFNPKAAWESIRRLTGGESSHHTSPQIIQIRIHSGNLAENDEENVSVFANHFKKVLNNHKPTDTPVINEIHLREVMEELDDPPL